ncbi:MAG: hypothetical protein JNN17_22190 [Verrucomicrobiaceae bacterium]|nr:hypothetical protein [Verrucomicrobiaceae bacterium]
MSTAVTRTHLLAGLVFILVVLGTYMPSMRHSQPVWIDEVMIVDYGRVMLDAEPRDIAVTYNVEANRPVKPVPWLGCVIQELAWRATGSPMGPRWVATLGSLAGVVMLGVWLCGHATSSMEVWAALTLCGTWFLESTFLDSYRGARVDGLAVAFVMASLLLAQGRAGAWRLLLAGVLLSASFFVWIRAVITWPVVLLAFADKERKAPALLTLVMGMAIGALLLVGPSLAGLADTALFAHQPLGDMGLVQRAILAFRSLASVLPPYLNLRWLTPLVLGVWLLTSKSARLRIPLAWWLGIGLVTLAGLVVTATHLHHFNRLFAFPLMVTAVWFFWQNLRPRLRTACLAVFVLTLALGYSVTALQRTLKADATPTASAEELSKHLKPGDRVLDPHFCHYYDLRRLGLVPLGLPLPEDVSVAKLKTQLKLDAAILSSGEALPAGMVVRLSDAQSLVSWRGKGH